MISGCVYRSQMAKGVLPSSMMNFFFMFVIDMDPKSLSAMNAATIPQIDPADMGLTSLEKGSTGPNSKPRKKTMTSVYLKYFETASDGKSRRCKFCGQSYSIATATGYILNYLSPFRYIVVHIWYFNSRIMYTR